MFVSNDGKFVSLREMSVFPPNKAVISYAVNFPFADMTVSIVISLSTC